MAKKISLNKDNKKEKNVEFIKGQKYYYKYIELPRGVDGKRNRKKIRAKSKSQLKSMIEVEKAKLQDGYNFQMDTSFNDFFKKWLFEVKFINTKASTKETYERVYRLHIKTASFATVKMSDLCVLNIQQYYNTCNKSSSLLRQMHNLIVPCLKYAFKVGVIKTDYSSILELPKNNTLSFDDDEVKILSVQDQRKLVNSLDNSNLYHNLILLALSTGLRIGEISALEWKDFNEAEGTLRINKTFKYVKDLETDKYVLSVTPPKTKNSKRTLKLSMKTINLLKHHRTQQNILKLKLGNKYKYSNLIFANKHGNYLAPHTIRENLDKALNAVGIEHINFHALRHTFATRLLERNVPTKVVSSILGHRDVQITQNLYQHVLDKLKEEVANIIEDII